MVTGNEVRRAPVHLALFLLWAAPGEEGAMEGDRCLRGQGGLDVTVQGQSGVGGPWGQAVGERRWRCLEGEFLTKHALLAAVWPIFEVIFYF